MFDLPKEKHEKLGC